MRQKLLMTAAAVALLVIHQAPAHAGHTHKPTHVTAAGSVGSNLLQGHNAILVAAVDPSRSVQALHQLPFGA